MKEIYHALVLNMHQPPSNLDELLETQPLGGEGDPVRLRPDAADAVGLRRHRAGPPLDVRHAARNPGAPRISSAVSTASSIAARCSGSLQNQQIFEILGTGYYHPVLALIPEADWDEQIGRWQALARHVFWRARFAGFWPPEMGFDEQLIPHLKKAGYRYVMVDCEYVDPVDDDVLAGTALPAAHLRVRGRGDRRRRARPRPVQRPALRHGLRLVHQRTASNAPAGATFRRWWQRPPTATTAAGSATSIRRPISGTTSTRQALDEVRAGHSPVRPIFIDDYLDRFGAHGRVQVRRGAWNTDTHHGWDFHQWQGGQMQRDALARTQALSAEFHAVKDAAARLMPGYDELQRVLHEAHWRLLRAETSCHFYWGDAWVYRNHSDLDGVQWHLGEARSILKPKLEEEAAERGRAEAEAMARATWERERAAAGEDPLAWAKSSPAPAPKESKPKTGKKGAAAAPPAGSRR